MTIILIIAAVSLWFTYSLGVLFIWSSNSKITAEGTYAFFSVFLDYAALIAVPLVPLFLGLGMIFAVTLDVIARIVTYVRSEWAEYRKLWGN